MSESTSYVFIDEGRPFLVFRGWMHYWNDGSKSWVTLREMSPEEREHYRGCAIPEKHAALYGYPFEKQETGRN